MQPNKWGNNSEHFTCCWLINDRKDSGFTACSWKWDGVAIILWWMLLLRSIYSMVISGKEHKFLVGFLSLAKVSILVQRSWLPFCRAALQISEIREIDLWLLIKHQFLPHVVIENYLLDTYPYGTSWRRLWNFQMHVRKWRWAKYGTFCMHGGSVGKVGETGRSRGFYSSNADNAWSSCIQTLLGAFGMLM